MAYTRRFSTQQREAAVVMATRLAESSPEGGYQVIDVVADHAAEAGDFAAAAAALHEFVTRIRFHLVALMRLVDICVDGGLEATMYEAQAQLADAYLEVGRGLEARIISEDLVAREPWNRANIERFRKSLVMLGEADPDAIIADRLSGDSPFMAADFIDLNEGEDLDEPLPDAPEAAAPTAAAEKPPAPAADSTPGDGKPQSQSLGDVFKEFRDEVGRSSGDEAAAEQYRLAITYQDMGMTEDAIAALESAARSPRQRFDAASMLGHLHLERGDVKVAVEWFEKAAEAPAPTTDASRALLYDLADTLEACNEGSRALAVFAELESESGGYRDVAARIEQLSRVQARG